MPQTIRLQILHWLQNLLTTVNTDNDPFLGYDDFPYTIKFKEARLGGLTAPDERTQYSAGLVPGRETKKTSQYPLDEATLPIAVEFRMTVNRGDKIAPGDAAEAVLGQVQNRLQIDNTCGGLAVDLRETANEIDLDSYGDKTVQGVVFIEVVYRHRTTKPHDPV